MVTENRPVRERGEEPDGMFPRQHSQFGEEAVSNILDSAGQAEERLSRNVQQPPATAVPQKDETLALTDNHDKGVGQEVMGCNVRYEALPS